MAIVGATGLVGRTMLKVLNEKHVPLDSLALFASDRSAGTEIEFRGETLTVQTLNEHSFDAIDIALFSAGGVLSRAFAPIAVKAGCTVIDNSSAFRMEPDVPLVVPEVNPHDAMNHHGIIANPNCSTIQLVLALEPIRKIFGLRRLIVSTYQSVSGAGQKGIDQLTSELQGIEPSQRISPHPLAFNTVFHGRPSDQQGASTEEEIKMRREIRRIMSMPQLPIAVTCVRIPTTGGHAESGMLNWNVIGQSLTYMHVLLIILACISLMMRNKMHIQHLSLLLRKMMFLSVEFVRTKIIPVG